MQPYVPVIKKQLMIAGLIAVSILITCIVPCPGQTAEPKSASTSPTRTTLAVGDEVVFASSSLPFTTTRGRQRSSSNRRYGSIESKPIAF